MVKTMIVYTFVGKCDQLDKIVFDYVVVDLYYHNCPADFLYKYKVILNNSKEDFHALRIKSNILKALEHFAKQTDTYAAIIDSDLYIPDIRSIPETDKILSPCYWAQMKPTNAVFPFCEGTNFFVPKRHLETFRYIVSTYDRGDGPVDLYIHKQLRAHDLVRYFLRDGTTHYVFGMPFEINHNIEPFLKQVYRDQFIGVI